MASLPHLLFAVAPTARVLYYITHALNSRNPPVNSTAPLGFVSPSSRLLTVLIPWSLFTVLLQKASRRSAVCSACAGITRRMRNDPWTFACPHQTCILPTVYTWCICFQLLYNALHPGLLLSKAFHCTYVRCPCQHMLLLKEDRMFG